MPKPPSQPVLFTSTSNSRKIPTSGVLLGRRGHLPVFAPWGHSVVIATAETPGSTTSNVAELLLTAARSSTPVIVVSADDGLLKQVANARQGSNITTLSLDPDTPGSARWTPFGRLQAAGGAQIQAVANQIAEAMVAAVPPVMMNPQLEEGEAAKHQATVRTAAVRMLAGVMANHQPYLSHNPNVHVEEIVRRRFGSGAQLAGRAITAAMGFRWSKIGLDGLEVGLDGSEPLPTFWIPDFVRPGATPTLLVKLPVSMDENSRAALALLLTEVRYSTRDRSSVEQLTTVVLDNVLHSNVQFIEVGAKGLVADGLVVVTTGNTNGALPTLPDVADTRQFPFLGSTIEPDRARTSDPVDVVTVERVDGGWSLQSGETFQGYPVPQISIAFEW